MTEVKEKKNQELLLTIKCYEQLENSSRRDVMNDRDPDLHVCIMQSDHLIFNYVMGAWLQFVYVSKRTFSSNIV